MQISMGQVLSRGVFPDGYRIKITSPNEIGWRLREFRILMIDGCQDR